MSVGTAAQTSTSNQFGLSWPLLFATFLCAGLLIQPVLRPLADPDTFWHITAGNWILEHRSIPVTDPFSYTRRGAHWVDHEWLSQVILALVYERSGWSGLVLLAIACCAVTAAYVMRFLLYRMQPLHALLFTAFAAATLFGHLLVRPHVLTWPLLALWVGTLITASEQNRVPPWWLLGIMVLWANLHLSHVLGLAIIVPLAFDAVMSSPRERRTWVLKRWGSFLAVCVVAALLTPAGWKSLIPFVDAFSLKHLTRIAEWRSANFSALSPLEFWIMLLLGLAFAGYLRLPAIRVLMVLGLLHQALLHSRFIAVFGLITPLLIALSFGERYSKLSAGKQQANGLDRLFAKLIAPARPVAIAVCTAIVLVVAFATGKSGKHAPLESITPKAAVDAALAAGVSGNVMNQYDFGGYLVYRGIPPFIDGRAEMYGNDIMEAYLNAVDSNDINKIEKSLADYKVSWTLLSPQSILVLYLNIHADWKKIYEDKVAVVHIRRDGR